MTLIRKNRGTGHSYTLDGNPVTGVTTLIHDGYPAEEGLKSWSGKVVAECVADADDTDITAWRDLGRDGMIAALRAQPRQRLKEASTRGTKVHRIAERLCRGEQLDYGTDIPEELEGHAESCLRFFDEWRPAPVLTEAVIGNRWVPYAGTLDMVADVPGHGRILIDYKSGASGIWPETVLQLAAYRWADCYCGTDGTEVPMVEVGIEATWAVWVRADGYDVIPLDTGDSRDHSAAFQTFRAVAYTAKRIGLMRSAIGAPLSPRKEVAA